MPVDTDYAWAAGFLDGEGHFAAVRHSNGRGYNPAIVATQTSKEPLERLQLILGGSICECKSKLRPGESRTWKWTLSSAKQLRDAIPMLYPHMTVKKEEAETLLRLCRLIHPSNGGRRGVPALNMCYRAHLAGRLKSIRSERKLAGVS